MDAADQGVALASVEDVQDLARAGEPLEATDWWSRTAWLVALLTGDLEKAQMLRAVGANTDARGRCGTPPLHFGIEGHHPGIVRWLLGIGQDVEQTDEFGTTPLMCAVDHSDLECIDILLAAGANVDRESKSGAVLGRTARKGIARRLLDAGCRPAPALAIVIVEVFAKKTGQRPASVLRACQRRLKEYDDA